MNFTQARKNMVDCQVRPDNVTNTDLQKAMGTVPREHFVPADRKVTAYMEKDVPLFTGRSLPQARDYAKLVNAALITKNDLVLDVACGYGYGTAILAKLADMVVGVEDTTDIVETAEAKLRALNIDNAAIMEGALSAGMPSQAPFDVILVNGVVDEVPHALFEQLKEGGRLGTFLQSGVLVHGCIYIKTRAGIGRRFVFHAQTRAVLSDFVRPAVFAL